MSPSRPSATTAVMRIGCPNSTSPARVHRQAVDDADARAARLERTSPRSVSSRCDARPRPRARAARRHATSMSSAVTTAAGGGAIDARNRGALAHRPRPSVSSPPVARAAASALANATVSSSGDRISASSFALARRAASRSRAAARAPRDRSVPHSRSSRHGHQVGVERDEVLAASAGWSARPRPSRGRARRSRRPPRAAWRRARATRRARRARGSARAPAAATSRTGPAGPSGSSAPICRSRSTRFMRSQMMGSVRRSAARMTSTPPLALWSDAGADAREVGEERAEPRAPLEVAEEVRVRRVRLVDDGRRSPPARATRRGSRVKRLRRVACSGSTSRSGSLPRPRRRRPLRGRRQLDEVLPVFLRVACVDRARASG